MRTIIELDQERLIALDAWAQSQEISRAEAIRRAVDVLIEQISSKSGEGFGLWTQAQAIPPERDGLRLQQELREEWPE